MVLKLLLIAALAISLHASERTARLERRGDQILIDGLSARALPENGNHPGSSSDSIYFVQQRQGRSHVIKVLNSELLDSAEEEARMARDVRKATETS
jgi:hypothetical protein